jgi:hypothetical protein
VAQVIVPSAISGAVRPRSRDDVNSAPTAENAAASTTASAPSTRARAWSREATMRGPLSSAWSGRRIARPRCCSPAPMVEWIQLYAYVENFTPRAVSNFSIARSSG